MKKTFSEDAYAEIATLLCDYAALANVTYSQVTEDLGMSPRQYSKV